MPTNISHFHSNNLSSPVRSLLDLVVEFQREQGREPLVKELLPLAGVAPTTTRSRLDRLQTEGLVAFRGPSNAVQFVSLTERGHLAQRLGKLPEPLPLYTGGAHAGARGTELDEPTQWVQCLHDVFRITDTANYYFLPIIGDCMNGGRRPIRPGSIVLFERRDRWNRPANGKAAHVEVELASGFGSEALLRDYYYDEATGLVRLVPRNSDESELTYPDGQVEPRGQVVQIVTTDDDDDRQFNQAMASARYHLPMKISGGAH